MLFPQASWIAAEAAFTSRQLTAAMVDDPDAWLPAGLLLSEPTDGASGATATGGPGGAGGAWRNEFVVTFAGQKAVTLLETATARARVLPSTAAQVRCHFPLHAVCRIGLFVLYRPFDLGVPVVLFVC